MSLEVHYIDAPEGAQENMTVEGQGNAVSAPSLLKTGARDIPWATLEPGVWVLNGTRKIMPRNPEVGFWSTVRSDSNGRFATPPRLTFNFPAPYSAAGFSFTFWPSTGQWCSRIRVTWYNAQTLLLEKEFQPDEARWILNESVESFDRMQVELLETNRPEQLAKLQRMEIGRNLLFTAEEIESVRLSCESDHSLCTIPVDTMQLQIYDRKERNLLPQENQRMEILENGVLKSSQYITSSTREAEHKYTIACQSPIGLLNDEHLGGIYTDMPLETLVAEILNGWEYEIDPYFDGVTITGYLPVGTQRSALQQVSFAVGALVMTQESRKIRLIPIPTATRAKFSASEIFLGGSVTTTPRIARVEVFAHSYLPDEVEETIIREEEIVGEDVLITFSSPHHSYVIEGGEITDSDVNWIKVTANGIVTVTAKKYIHTSVAHVKRNPAATAKERGNYVSVTEATLVTGRNVYDALDRLYNANLMSQTVQQDVVVSNQKAGDIASSLTPWGSIARGYISSMESEMTQNGHTATIYIHGIEVKLESVWMYSGEIYSGGMEVVY